jgi:hypothetical protein
METSVLQTTCFIKHSRRCLVSKKLKVTAVHRLQKRNVWTVPPSVAVSRCWRRADGCGVSGQCCYLSRCSPSFYCGTVMMKGRRQTKRRGTTGLRSGKHCERSAGETCTTCQPLWGVAGLNPPRSMHVLRVVRWAGESHQCSNAVFIKPWYASHCSVVYVRNKNKYKNEK